MLAYHQTIFYKTDFEIDMIKYGSNVTLLNLKIDISYQCYSIYTEQYNCSCTLIAWKSYGHFYE